MCSSTRISVALAAALVIAPGSAEGQRKKNIQPAPLPVAANTVNPGVVRVTWLEAQKVSVYEVARCDGGGVSCVVKTRLSAFAPREMQDNLSGYGTYLYRVTAYGSNQVPLAEGQVGYIWEAPKPVSAVLLPPPPSSGTITPINVCAVAPRNLNMGMIRVTIQASAPNGASLDFEAWQDPLVVGHAVDRAPAGTGPTGSGWTTLATTCDAAAQFAPRTTASGRPGFWFRDVTGGLTPGSSYQYRARGVLSNADYYVNVSPPWQAPGPIPPTMLAPVPPDPNDDEIVLWIRWEQNLVWNGIRIKEPDDYLVTSSWGQTETRPSRCPCSWIVRSSKYGPTMPTGTQSVTVTARWGAVTASSTQTVSR